MQPGCLKSLKTDLISAHLLGQQGKRIKSVHLPSRLKWFADSQHLPQMSMLFNCVSRRKRPCRQSASKSKDSHLTIDISNIQGSKDSLAVRKTQDTEPCRGFVLQQLSSNIQEGKHQRGESEVKLRKTDIYFRVKKSLDKPGLYRNRKMSLPMRSGPILPPKIKKKDKPNNENNIFTGSLLTHRLQSNHPEVSVMKLRSNPKVNILKCQSVMLPIRKRIPSVKTIQVPDFQIKPWIQENQRDESLDEFLI